MKRLIKKASATWIVGPEEVFRDEGRPGYDNPRAETMKEKGELSLDFLKTLSGYNNENHQWTEWTRPEDGQTFKYFGNYEEKEWEEFIEDIKTNGIKNPILVQVEVDGKMTIVEGNHRVAAAEQLGLQSVPTEVLYRGNSQRNFQIQ